MSGVVYQGKASMPEASSSSSIKKSSTLPSTGSSKKSSQYFEQVKKGEVDELRE